MRWKSCVLLPAAGRRTQLFHLMITQPGVCGFADPCTTHLHSFVYASSSSSFSSFFSSLRGVALLTPLSLGAKTYSLHSTSVSKACLKLWQRTSQFACDQQSPTLVVWLKKNKAWRIEAQLTLNERIVSKEKSGRVGGWDAYPCPPYLAIGLSERSSSLPQFPTLKGR